MDTVFISVPKKSDLLQCSNYGTIALVSHASKILLRVILGRMQLKIKGEAAPEQAGLGRGETYVIRLQASESNASASARVPGCVRSITVKTGVPVSSLINTHPCMRR